jgi:TrkA domain protein
MAVSITTRSLPGIGVCHEITLNEGSRFAIVTRRSGLRDLVVYDKDDTDEARVDLVLEEAEANAIAELLGGPQIMNALKAIDDTKGLVVQQLPLHAKSPYGGPPGRYEGTHAYRRLDRGRLRDNEVHPSPRPDFVLKAGDLIAVVGTEDAIEKLAAILDGNKPDSS